MTGHRQADARVPLCQAEVRHPRVVWGDLRLASRWHPVATLWGARPVLWQVRASVGPANVYKVWGEVGVRSAGLGKDRLSHVSAR